MHSLIARVTGILLILSTSNAVRASAELQVGFAKTVITPDELMWLNGYAGRTAPASGKIHDLWAKCVAFQDASGTRLVLLTFDLGAVNVEMTEAIAAQAQTRYKLSRENLVLICSHTHCAPEISAERAVFHNMPEGELIKLARYIEKTNAQLVELIGSSLADLKPAKLAVSQSTALFAFNRRAPGGIDLAGATDRDVPVLQVLDRDGKLRGILFGYACHNTTLSFQEYCGDYAGFAQYEIEAAHPGAVAMFVTGCAGDQNPQPRHGPLGLAYAKHHGRSLAQAVERALDDNPQEVSGPLRVAYREAKLDLASPPDTAVLREQAKQPSANVEARKAQYLLNLIDAGKELPLTQSCPLHVAKFGDNLLMLFISGETVVDYSLRCKVDFKGPFVWVAGYCDDVFGYLPSRRVQLEGGYEGQISAHRLMAAPFQPNVEDRVMTALKELVAEVDRGR